MTIAELIKWLKRATGFGYHSYPPLEELIDQERAHDMERQSRTLRDEVIYVETILSRRENERSPR